MSLANLKGSCGWTQACFSCCIVFGVDIIIGGKFLNISSPSYFDICTSNNQTNQQLCIFIDTRRKTRTGWLVWIIIYTMKLYLLTLGVLLLMVPVIQGAELAVQPESNQTQPQANRSQSNLNEFQIAELQIKQNLNKLQLQQGVLVVAVDTLNNIKNDLNATINRYSQPEVQDQYKQFFKNTFKLIIENIILLVIVIIIAGGLLYCLIAYLLKRRSNKSPSGLHRINQIYIQSEHSSSTNLQSISQRSNNEPTL